MRALACGPGEELVGAGWSRSALRSSLQSTGTLRTWPRTAGPPASAELDRRGDEIVALGATRDGRRVAGARENGHLSTWDLATRKRVGGELEHGGDVTALVYTRDARRLVAAGRDGRWSTWLPGRTAAASRGRHAGGLTSAHLWSNDRHLVTGGTGGTVRIWDVAAGEELGELRGHSGPVLCDALPDHREIVSAGDDRILHLWSVELTCRLGAAAAAVTAALGATASDPIAQLDLALDAWRDLERAPRLMMSFPAELRALHDRIIALADRAGPTAADARRLASPLQTFNRKEPKK